MFCGLPVMKGQMIGSACRVGEKHCAGCAYLWSVAMDSEKPSIASGARDLLVALHLDLSEELQQQQASVRATLIM